MVKLSFKTFFFQKATWLFIFPRNAKKLWQSFFTSNEGKALSSLPEACDMRYNFKLAYVSSKIHAVTN